MKRKKMYDEKKDGKIKDSEKLNYFMVKNGGNFMKIIEAEKR